MADKRKTRARQTLKGDLEQWAGIVSALRGLECLVEDGYTAGFIDLDRLQSITAHMEDVMCDLVSCVPTESRFNG